MPVYDIPDGPANLKQLFPDINFREIEEYYVELLNSSGGVIATTSRNWLNGCCDDEKVTVFFLGSGSGIDMVSGRLKKIDDSIKADSYEKPKSLPHTVNSGGLRRNGVSAGEVISAKIIDYEEKDLKWLREFYRSPLHWIGRGDEYVPVVLQGTDFPVLKEEERFDYKIDFELLVSNEFITQRT